MLHVWLPSGEELASVPAENLTDVKSLKQHLHSLCGLPRFRQRLLCERDPVDDHASLHVPMDVQLILLPFAEATLEQRNEMTSAASWADPVWMEELLQRPQDPSLPDFGQRIPLHMACHYGHMRLDRFRESFAGLLLVQP